MPTSLFTGCSPENTVSPKPHEWLFGVGAGGNVLGCGVAVGGEVNLVLHQLEEGLGFRCARVVVHAGGVEVEHLPVKHLLAGANVADALQKLAPIAAAARLLQQLVIHGEALDEILAQHPQGPAAEKRAAQGLDPVTDRDDHVQVVVLGVVIFAVSGSSSEIPNY
jgi:hypothetical protein